MNQVADTPLDTYDPCNRILFIRGFEPLEDVMAYGALISRTHEIVAARDRTGAAAA